MKVTLCRWGGASDNDIIQYIQLRALPSALPPSPTGSSWCPVCLVASRGASARPSVARFKQVFHLPCNSPISPWAGAAVDEARPSPAQLKGDEAGPKNKCGQ